MTLLDIAKEVTGGGRARRTGVRGREKKRAQLLFSHAQSCEGAFRGCDFTR